MQTTKRRKIASLRPPQDVRENTKARRAWLAETAARVQSEPNREAKIVGQGSYQEVSVWAVETTPARAQTRGTCQGCGRVQAVVDGRVAKHGYTVQHRGQGGFFAGTCHASDRAPAEVSVDFTQHLIETCRALANGARLALPGAEQDAKAAVRPACAEPRKVWDRGRQVWPNSDEARAWRRYYALVGRPSALRHEASQMDAHVEHLTAHVLPRFGQALYQVPV